MTAPDSSGNRLLLVVPWLALGGADKFNVDLTRQLSQAGWDVRIVTSRRADPNSTGGVVAGAREIVSLAGSALTTNWAESLLDVIATRRIDVVLLSHSELGYRVLPYLRASLPGVTFADYCHLEEAWGNGGYARLSVDHREFLDLTIVSSAHLKRWMTARGARPERVHVAYTGVDADLWSPDVETRWRVRREFAMGDETPMLLFVGRICAQKQPLVLARTIARLRDRGLEFGAVIAGDGPDSPELQRFIEANGLGDRIHLLGAVPSWRVRELMAAADVFLLPSQMEGIALSIYEAMACGLAVVSADVGGQRELVTAECGILVAAGQPGDEVDRYTAAVESLLRQPERRVQMGRAGRTRVLERFRLDQLLDRMVTLLRLAEHLHMAHSRALPQRARAERAAQRAAASMEFLEHSDERWSNRDRSSWRVQAYELLARQFGRWYEWGSRRGWQWLPRLRARVRHVMLQRR